MKPGGKWKVTGAPFVFPSVRAQGNLVQGAAGSDRPLLRFQCWTTTTVATVANVVQVSNYGLYLSIHEACLFMSVQETWKVK